MSCIILGLCFAIFLSSFACSSPLAICKDGLLVYSEKCDPTVLPTAQPFGCSTACLPQPGYTCVPGDPIIASNGTCTPNCSDGIVSPPEECDNGYARGMDFGRFVASFYFISFAFLLFVFLEFAIL
jgi:hypothetical protein